MRNVRTSIEGDNEFLKNDVDSMVSLWRNSNEVAHKSNKVVQAKGIEQKQFASALLEANISDNRHSSASGTSIDLPFGVELFEYYAAFIKKVYTKHALREYRFPDLVARVDLDRTNALLSLNDKILYIATDSDILRQRYRVALRPTGESGVYTYFRSRIRTRLDLPLMVFQRAKYFRPIPLRRRDAGDLLEHVDIFEFHCAYPTISDLENGFEVFRLMLKSICKQIGLPVLWSTRPTWGNHPIADFCVVADVPLPNGGTSQVAAIYFQNQKFSIPYEVSYKENQKYLHTYQLTGYVSRRLLLSTLLLTMNEFNHMLIPPFLSPYQVAILKSDDNIKSIDAERIINIFNERNIRCQLFTLASKKETKQSFFREQSKGIPVIMLIFGKRTANDQNRVVVFRNDDRTEEVLMLSELERVPGIITTLLDEISQKIETKLQTFLANRCITPSSKGFDDVLSARLIAICPLLAEEPAVSKIGLLGRGEVLGFVKTRHTVPCFTSGSPVSTLAFISTRF